MNNLSPFLNLLAKVLLDYFKHFINEMILKGTTDSWFMIATLR